MLGCEVAGNSFRAALVDEVRRLNYAETQLSKAHLKKPSGSTRLRRAIANHLEENRGQITLPELISLLEEKARGPRDTGRAAGILEQGSDVIRPDMDEAEMDACMIAVIAWADALDPSEVAAPRTHTRFGEADDDEFEDDDDEARPVQIRMPERMGTLARAARQRAKNS